jgi:aminoglycoside phosphotransferase (APT) family kinase protein
MEPEGRAHPGARMAIPTEELCERLRRFLASETGSDVQVKMVGALAGGASRAAYAMDIAVEKGEQAGDYPTVLRLDLGGKIYEASLGRIEECRVLRQAKKGGVLVPRALWASDDPSVLERDFVVLERIDGETIGTRIVQRVDLAEARRLLPEQMGRELAKIHALEAAEMEFLPRPKGNESPAEAVLHRCRAELDKVGGAHPALEVGWRWLSDQAPECSESVFVHGDFRLGNFVVGPEGLRSVLDWEFASVGDPHEDLAWPFVRDWRFGNDQLRMGGGSDGEDFLMAYEAASGRSVDRHALRYWEILGNFRWALGCLTQSHRHLSGRERSIELASLGRRSGEMELEMLDLIAREEG